MLTNAQRLRYAEDGFLVLPGFKPQAALTAVRERARAIVADFQPEGGLAVFSSVDRERTADAALIASAEAVHCFFEEEAFDAAGRLTRPQAVSVNKIGHALHEHDAVFRPFSRGSELAALAADLGLQQAQVWQSQVIFKQPGIGGAVRWHQDATFFDSDPSSVTTFWFALEDADRDNGCLWVQPGGHRSPLRERFVREGPAAGKGVSLRMQALDNTPWPEAAQALPLEVAAGTVVCFHGHLPHGSAANRSARSRMAYTLHATDGRARYAASNWLQRSAALPVRGFID